MKYNKQFPHLLFIILIAIIFFLPFFTLQFSLTNRNNDLQEFKNNMAFFKENILQKNHFPLWQNRILSGTPYLGDPQNPLLYLPNYLSLLMPLDTFFVGFFFLHYILAMVGMFHLARKLNASFSAALIAAVVYALSPKFVGHLEAGHFNMLAAFSWVPVAFYTCATVKYKASVVNVLLLGYALAAVFLNYITIFIYLVPALVIFTFFFVKPNVILKNWKLFLLSALVFLLISLPQIQVASQYFPLSTRQLITIEDVGPNVVSMRRFITSIVSPYSYGLDQVSAENILSFGIIPLIMAGIGFMVLDNKKKIAVLVVSAAIIFIALGTKTPLFTSLLEVFPQLMIFRIPTRIWFISIVLISILSAIALDAVIKQRFIKLLIVSLVTLELSFLSWQYFKAHDSRYALPLPITTLTKSIEQEAGYFRVYCTTNCIPHLSGKGVAHGYNPIQLKNYYDFVQSAAGYRFGSYAVSLPPYQTYTDKPQPNSEMMGLLGVRYIISPFAITAPGFFQLPLAGINVYTNTDELPRAYIKKDNRIISVPVILDRPGKVIVNTDNQLGTLVLNEIYAPFWKATTDGQPLPLTAYQNIILSTVIEKPTETVTFSFHPPFIDITFPLSIITSVVIFVILFSWFGSQTKTLKLFE